ncbi:MAG: apolipoprotein N-acyltransferase [Sphingomonadales bacterium 35-56-22]|jgi:apolipoprotein N-acyltransferase|uniref:apolipoprotein N-acyltransferase n=1 Tax=Sphingorhabdus sp. TaxID=1902408 RepID=UPI000BCDD4E3|nr:apolipoprotein N-acyltransferase [Sphingorhabdus sp.]OYY15782.1 MAG: apolipoprotein N-acyltransferase [Sphingomonadales bacterium 35-56-22]OYY97771.1 MAG: apolipoprotein N-acyltransferase [Sphingomonadales bacterium 28-56-43]OYZ61327.1 MAG: apolipoprotein N-acyltransferase [Sphingomonadales bacterium 24-56-14]OZA82748.1 MAG: apolipoprotein N-acyltransferase [Sphingomonadales bacterium 39-57-19]HQS12893.1 apolipoprotein N-acyltransferase [Sphingorhabdus sp.]
MQKLSALLGKFPRWTALVAGAASAYGFEPWGLWPLTFVCFALLIQLISQAPSTKGAFMLGWLFGVGHFTFGNQWIAVAFTFQAAMPIWLGYIAVFGLALYLAVYPALAAAGAHWINHRTTNALPDSGRDDAKPRPTATLHLILAFAGLWIITEWLRSWVFTGYVWNPLSVITLSVPYLSQPATALGTYGLSGFMLLFVGMILKFVTLWTSASGVERGDGARTGYFLGGLILLALAAVAITGRSSFDQSAPVRTPVALTIAQPNISQADKYAPGYDAINFAKLAMNSRPMPDQGARLILWPEAAIPDYLEEGYPYRYYQGQPDESATGARARLTTLMGDGDVLVTGANRLVIEKGQLVAARNSVSAMDANGNILGHYDKAHLVPYGEYLPLPWLLRPLGLARLVPGDLDFWPGPGAQTMTVNLNGKPVKIGIQICYEMIFSGQVTDRTNRPDFIFNPSNDAWFGTIGPPQHLAQARLRAIEEGLPVVRATPTGISAVIDANGRIIKSLPLGTSGRIDAVVPQAKAPTLFARFGNILPLGFAGLLIACALLPLARRTRSR